MVNASRGVGGTVGGRPGPGGSWIRGNAGYKERSHEEARHSKWGTNKGSAPPKVPVLREFSPGLALSSFSTPGDRSRSHSWDVDQMATASGGNPLLGNNDLYRDDATTGMEFLRSSKETGGKYYSNGHPSSTRRTSTRSRPSRGPIMCWAIPRQRSPTASSIRSGSRSRERVARSGPSPAISIPSRTESTPSSRRTSNSSTSPSTRYASFELRSPCLSRPWPTMPGRARGSWRWP